MVTLRDVQVTEFVCKRGAHNLCERLWQVRFVQTSWECQWVCVVSAFVWLEFDEKLTAPNLEDEKFWLTPNSNGKKSVFVTHFLTTAVYIKRNVSFHFISYRRCRFNRRVKVKIKFLGGIPCVVVMGDDSCSKGCGFESRGYILDVHYSHWFVVPINV